MDYYIDIKLLKDPEFSAPMLMSALFSKLHRVLVNVSENDIGVSFPRFSKDSLGDTLRIHASQSRLAQLETLPWRKGLGDFSQVSGVLPVPDTTECYLVKRVHVQSNVERLRRRAMKRHNLTHEQAVEKIPDTAERQIKNLPFVRITSQSTGGQQFRLYIEQTTVAGHIDERSQFSKYGLSAITSVPKF